MSGNKTGGKLAAETNMKWYCADFYKRLGSKGGSVRGIEKGFSLMSPEERVANGRKGGKLSFKWKHKAYEPGTTVSLDKSFWRKWFK